MASEDLNFEEFDDSDEDVSVTRCAWCGKDTHRWGKVTYNGEYICKVCDTRRIRYKNEGVK